MTPLDQILSGAPARLYVGGEWRPAGDGAEIDVFDPSTAAPFTRVAVGSVEDAIGAVEAADAAAAAWAASSPVDRSEVLRRAYELMLARADDIAVLVVREMGKAYSEAKAEVRYAAEFFRWYSGEAVRNIGSIQTAPAGDKRIVTIHQPVGVSLLVTPWNFPAAMATRKIGPAVAAGCTMVLKPASATPLTALAIAAVLADAGLPPGVLNVVPARNSGAAVAAMLGDRRVRKLSFTGSTEVGRGLLRLAADRVVNCSMELGGNAPFVVLEGADVDAAVEGAMHAKIRNGGQSCIAANRFLVHSAVAGAFTEELSTAMASLRVGPGMEDGVQLGPLISAPAQTDMDEFVTMATDAGATVTTGGSAPDRTGYFFAPTVLADVAADSPVLDHEVFGPLAPVVTFDDDDQAVTLANASPYGLAAYVYGGELGRTLRVAERIEAGMVGVNRGLISDPAAAFGGVKESGLGREGGHEGLLEFLEAKYLAVDW